MQFRHRRNAFSLIVLSFVGLGCGGKTAQNWNVLLVSLDTLRADRLGAAGYHRSDISPALDRLASEGVRFEQAISQAPWTTPSHMSLLTSQYPSTHGVNQGWNSFITLGEADSGYRTLPASALTLAEVLHEQEYATMALTGGGTIAAEIGFDQGFDVFKESLDGFDERELLTGWLESRQDRPFFLFVQSFEIHAPYERLEYAKPLLAPRQIDELSRLIDTSDDVLGEFPVYLIKEGLFRHDVTTALYDGGVRYADGGLEWLFSELDLLGLTDRTLIVVTSDHGEEFGEHDPTRLWDAHCSTVYDELIRVPLIIRAPGETLPPNSTVKAQVELIDVAPTILGLLGLPTPESFQGVSLLPLMRGEQPSQERWALSEATCAEPEMKSIRGGRHKYVAAFTATDDERTGLAGDLLWEKVFDLEKDPGEQLSLHDSEPELLAELRARLQERLALAVSQASGDSQSTPVSQKTVDRLRSLGYVQ